MRLSRWGLIILALGGIWLMVSPFWLGFPRPASDPWVTSVLVSVLAGGLVTALSLTGLTVFTGLSLREIQSAARDRKSIEAAVQNPEREASGAS